MIIGNAVFLHKGSYFNIGEYSNTPVDVNEKCGCVSDKSWKTDCIRRDHKGLSKRVLMWATCICTGSLMLYSWRLYHIPIAYDKVMLLIESNETRDIIQSPYSYQCNLD